MPFSEALVARIRKILTNSVGISERKMFGGVAFLKFGHMFVGVTQDDLMARVGKQAHAASLARSHVRPMDFTGRPMTGYVFVGSQGLMEDSELSFWIEHCEKFVQTLPVKETLIKSPRSYTGALTAS